jgi:transcriptional regulator with XRE-family HTH domain
MSTSRSATGEDEVEAALSGPAAVRFGLELRRARMYTGLSQRKLAEVIGLATHSSISEFERGVRLPCGDIAHGLAQGLPAHGAILRAWYQWALAERAERWLCEELRRRAASVQERQVTDARDSLSDSQKICGHIGEPGRLTPGACESGVSLLQSPRVHP